MWGGGGVYVYVCARLFELCFYVLNMKEDLWVCIQATNTIMPGKCVLTEEPFAAVLKEGFLLAHCSHCFKEALLIP